MEELLLMKTPAEKCAERIAKHLRLCNPHLKPIEEIIQSEYAPTIQVAREATEKALKILEPAQSEDVKIQLRTALEQLEQLTK